MIEFPFFPSLQHRKHFCLSFLFFTLCISLTEEEKKTVAGFSENIIISVLIYLALCLLYFEFLRQRILCKKGIALILVISFLCVLLMLLLYLLAAEVWKIPMWILPSLLMWRCKIAFSKMSPNICDCIKSATECRMQCMIEGSSTRSWRQRTSDAGSFVPMMTTILPRFRVLILVFQLAYFDQGVRVHLVECQRLLHKPN